MIVTSMFFKNIISKSWFLIIDKWDLIYQKNRLIKIR